MASWTHITVGVADVDEALGLWVDEFGFEVVAEHAGPDPGLAEFWGLGDGSAIVRQAVVATPGESRGQIHLVQFADPGVPVRHGAEVFDLLPKNLDIHAEDLPAKFEMLKAKGRTFRSDRYSEVTSPSGTTFREIHMKGHDETNIVLLEVLGESEHYSPKGFSGVGPVITIVPDAAAEQQFYVDALGLEVLSENLLKGPEIERMVGLPPGAGLDVRVLGHGDEHFGRIEIVDYQGVEGENRYPRAVPPALGTLHVRYELENLEPLTSRLEALGVDYRSHDSVETLLGSGSAIVFRSPAGFRIEAQQTHRP